MDAVSLALNQSILIQFVRKRALKIYKAQSILKGQYLAQMIQRSVLPNLGENMDIKI